MTTGPEWQETAVARASYRTPVLGRGVLLGAFAAALVAFLAAAITSMVQAETSHGRGGAPIWFLLAWLAIYSFLA